MNKLENTIRKLTRIRFLQHLVFWLLSFRILLGIFSSSSETLRIDYIYTTVFIFTLMIPVYLNLNFFIPGFLSKRKFLLYGLSFVLTVSVFSFLNQLMFNRLIDYIFPGYFFISYYEYADILIFFVVFLSLTSLLKLSKGWFFVSEARKKLMETEKQKVENELKALKSQLNPHFMFNSLNNIYSLSLQNSDQTSAAIVKLGDILRYVIYEARNEKVKLREEVKMIRDYIDLEKLRSRDPQIIFRTENINENQEISPLLFLPLVENGFKHGIHGDPEGYFNIFMSCEGNVLKFETENNRGEVDNVEKSEYRGIGILNVKRRLEISYPGAHNFSVEENEKSFSVKMEVHLNA